MICLWALEFIPCIQKNISAGSTKWPAEKKNLNISSIEIKIGCILMLEILGSTLAQVSCGLLFVVSAKNHARNFKREIKFEHKNAATKVFQKAYLLSKQWRDFTF